jgi:membrane protein DedA with SNARE-associated domain
LHDNRFIPPFNRNDRFLLEFGGAILVVTFRNRSTPPAAMWYCINAIVDLVAHYPGGALGVVFLAAIIEAVAVVGILIPGTPILMAVAGAAAMAGQPMLPFLVLSIIGAVIGDFLSFWVGKRFSFQLRRVWPFCSRPELMKNAVGFFERYGFFSVALCRFVPVLRSTVPLVAGMAGMRQRRFVIANVASAFVWAPVHIYPAQLAGLSLGRLRDGDWQSAALWGAVLLAGCAVAWAMHRVVVARTR